MEENKNLMNDDVKVEAEKAVETLIDDSVMEAHKVEEAVETKKSNGFNFDKEDIEKTFQKTGEGIEKFVKKGDEIEFLKNIKDVRLRNLLKIALMMYIPYILIVFILGNGKFIAESLKYILIMIVIYYFDRSRE